MAGIYPDPTVAAELTTIAHLRAWAGLSEEAFDAVTTSTGDLGTEPRFIAMLPAVIWREAIAAARIDLGAGPRPLTPTETARAGVIWQVAQRLAWVGAGNEWATFAEVDPGLLPMATPAATTTTAVGAALATSPAHKIKLDNVIGQGDETEVVIQPATKMIIWNQNYIAATGGLPEEGAQCSLEQITALEYRIAIGMTPYANFGVFGPYYGRAKRAGKFKTWIPLGNGTYLTKVLPGPENYDQWKASFRVFSVGLLSLQVATALALQKYGRCIEKLAHDYPEAWHLVAAAENKMRAEYGEIIRTRITRDITEGLPAPETWDATHPWIAVFELAAEDKEFWDEQVHKPASIWLQHGGKDCPLAPDERVDKVPIAGSIDAPNSGLPPPGHDLPKSSDQAERKKMSYWIRLAKHDAEFQAAQADVKEEYKKRVELALNWPPRNQRGRDRYKAGTGKTWRGGQGRPWKDDMNGTGSHYSSGCPTDAHGRANAKEEGKAVSRPSTSRSPIQTRRTWSWAHGFSVKAPASAAEPPLDPSGASRSVGQPSRVHRSPRSGNRTRQRSRRGARVERRGAQEIGGRRSPPSDSIPSLPSSSVSRSPPREESTRSLELPFGHYSAALSRATSKQWTAPGTGYSSPRTTSAKPTSTPTTATKPASARTTSARPTSTRATSARTTSSPVRTARPSSSLYQDGFNQDGFS